MNVAAALHAVLTGDATLTALLAEYEGEPAVFTKDPVPKDAPWPFVVISGSETDDDAGAKNEGHRSIARRIRVYDDSDDGSVITIDAIGERIRALLHRTPFTLTGGTVYMVDVQGPLDAPSGPDTLGRALIVRILVGPAA